MGLTVVGQSDGHMKAYERQRGGETEKHSASLSA